MRFYGRQSTETDKIETTLFEVWGSVVLLFAVVFASWWWWPYILAGFGYTDPAESPGTYGDSYGALNTLFSGWAFCGVIVAILMQRTELVLQRKEFEQARRALTESATAQNQASEIAKLQMKVSMVQAELRFAEIGLEKAELELQTANDALRALESEAKVNIQGAGASKAGVTKHYEPKLELARSRAQVAKEELQKCRDRFVSSEKFSDEVSEEIRRYG